MHTFEEVINRFKVEYNMRFERATIEAYQTSIRQLLTFYNKPYTEISTQDIRNWLMHLEEKGYKKGSIKNKIIGLRMFYRYCMEEEFMKYNPAKSVHLPSVEDKLPSYLTNEQLAELRLLAEGNLKQRAVIEVLYSTGVRLRELTNIKLQDIHWEERTIIIPSGKGKKERIVLFTGECAEHLRAYLQVRGDELPYLFLNRYEKGAINPRGIQYWFMSYSEKLGFSISPHTLRHTFATHLAMKGMSPTSLQALLGHSHLRHTRLYIRPYQRDQKDMYDAWM